MIDFIKKRLFRNKTMIDDIPKDWRNALDGHVGRVRWRNTITGIEAFLQNEESENRAYQPEGQDIFAAFKATPFHKVRVVIIGKDPYPKPRDVTGIAFFSNRNPTKSLKNIYTAMGRDGIGNANLTNACLKRWAEEEYVLLLNSALTLHKDVKENLRTELWKCFIQAVVEALSNSGRPIHFMLWGGHAKVFEYYIKTPPCHIHTTNHPSQRNGGNLDVFLNCHHFSAVNTEIAGREGEDAKIKWIVPPEEA